MIKVTIEVEITDRRAGMALEQKLVAVEHGVTSCADYFAPAVTEVAIATGGRALVAQVADLYGDVRNSAPSAPGITDAMHRRPLSGISEEALNRLDRVRRVVAKIDKRITETEGYEVDGLVKAREWLIEALG